MIIANLIASFCFHPSAHDRPLFMCRFMRPNDGWKVKFVKNSWVDWNSSLKYTRGGGEKVLIKISIGMI